MTLTLDLSETQQQQVASLLAQKIAERKTIHKKKEEIRKQKLSANERYKKMIKKLDAQITFTT